MLSRLWPPIGRPALSDQLAAMPVTMGERPGSDDARCSTQIADLAWLPSRGAAVDCAHNDLSVRLDDLERPVRLDPTCSLAEWYKPAGEIAGNFSCYARCCGVMAKLAWRAAGVTGHKVGLAGQLRYAELCWRARGDGT